MNNSVIGLDIAKHIVTIQRTLTTINRTRMTRIERIYADF
jgi:hypothetical protein